MRRFAWECLAVSSFLLVAASPLARAEQGCCAKTGDPSSQVFTIGLTDPDDCANVNGVVTSQEGCEAMVSQGKVTVIGGTGK